MVLPFNPDDSIKNYTHSNDTLDFYFNDLAVKVLFNEIILFNFADNSPYSFGLDNGGTEGGHVPSDSFLRSAYVVYDLDQSKIGLANTVFTRCYLRRSLIVWHDMSMLFA